MTLLAKDYRNIWQQLIVQGDKETSGGRLKTEMGGTTNPTKLGPVVSGGVAALKDHSSWTEALKLAADTLLDLSTAQFGPRAEWAQALSSYLGANILQAFGGKNHTTDVVGTTSADLVGRYRGRITAAIVRILESADDAEDSAQLGERAVLGAYQDMYSVRQNSTFKSFWTSTNTDIHLAPVWASIVALKIHAPVEQNRREEHARELERQRIAAERHEQEQSRLAALARKRLFRLLTVKEDELAYDRDQKNQINTACTELARDYPVDVLSYNEVNVNQAVSDAKDRLLRNHGYQLSGNKQGVINTLDQLIATARQKKYPLELADFVNKLAGISIGMFFIGVSGSDDADKKEKGGVELRR